MKQKPSQAMHAKRWRTALSVGLGASILAALSGCGGDSPVAQVADLRGSDYVKYQLNNAGQIAWLQEDDERAQVYLDGARLADIASSQGSYDLLGKMSFNDMGQLVWVSSKDDGSRQLFMFNGQSIVQIADEYLAPHSPYINNSGQIVFVDEDGEHEGGRVLMYKNGNVLALTDADSLYLAPQINDNGGVSWLGLAWGMLNQFMYQDGVVSLVSDRGILLGEEAYEEGWYYSRRVNNRGQVVWDSNENGDQYDNIVYLYDGSDIVKLSPMSHNRNPMINEVGQVVWQGWDGNDYEIFFYSSGQIIQITNNNTDDDQPVINDLGVVAWAGSDGKDWEIFTYDGGSITQLTDNEEDDREPQINNNGYVAWLTRNGNGELQGLYRAKPRVGHIIQSAAGMIIEPSLSRRIQANLAINSVVNTQHVYNNAGGISHKTTSESLAYSFVVLGDSRYAIGWTGGGVETKFPAEYLSDLANHIAKIDPTPKFVVFVGDMATYPYNGKNDYLSAWFHTFADPLYKNGIPVYPVMGNHETFKWGSGAWQYDHAMKSLDTFHEFMGKYQLKVSYLQKLKDAKGNLTSKDDYGSYYWDFGDSRFVVLNYYSEKNPAGGDSGLFKQVDVINNKELFAEINRNHVFVFGHSPLQNNNNLGMTILSSRLRENGVDAYFAGHSHKYRHELIGDIGSSMYFHEVVTGAAGADIVPPTHINCKVHDSGVDRFYSVAERFNYAVVDVYDGGSVRVTSYVTKDDYAICHDYHDYKIPIINVDIGTLPKSCTYTGFPEMVQFEQFYVKKYQSHVRDADSHVFCDVPK